MINPLLSPIEDFHAVELPFELYDMMRYMKFTVDTELERNVVRKLNIPVLARVSPNTTPVDSITRNIRTALISYIEEIKIPKNIF